MKQGVAAQQAKTKLQATAQKDKGVQQAYGVAVTEYNNYQYYYMFAYPYPTTRPVPHPPLAPPPPKM